MDYTLYSLGQFDRLTLDENLKLFYQYHRIDPEDYTFKASIFTEWTAYDNVKRSMLNFEGGYVTEHAAEYGVWASVGSLDAFREITEKYKIEFLLVKGVPLVHIREYVNSLGDDSQLRQLHLYDCPDDDYPGSQSRLILRNITHFSTENMEYPALDISKSVDSMVYYSINLPSWSDLELFVTMSFNNLLYLRINTGSFRWIDVNLLRLEVLKLDSTEYVISDMAFLDDLRSLAVLDMIINARDLPKFRMDNALQSLTLHVINTEEGTVFPESIKHENMIHLSLTADKSSDNLYGDYDFYYSDNLIDLEVTFNDELIDILTEINGDTRVTIRDMDIEYFMNEIDDLFKQFDFDYTFTFKVPDKDLSYVLDDERVRDDPKIITPLREAIMEYFATVVRDVM